MKRSLSRSISKQQEPIISEEKHEALFCTVCTSSIYIIMMSIPSAEKFLDSFLYVYVTSLGTLVHQRACLFDNSPGILSE